MTYAIDTETMAAPTSIDDARRQYVAGAPVKLLAERMGISAGKLYRAFGPLGSIGAARGPSDTQRIKAERMRHRVDRWAQSAQLLAQAPSVAQIMERLANGLREPRAFTAQPKEKSSVQAR